MNNKKYSLLKIVVVSFVLLIILGGTYAYWTWTSTNNKKVVFSTAGINDYIVYDEGESYFVGDYQPYDNFCDSVHTTISIYKTQDAANIDLRASIKMDVNSIGENISLSDNVHYVVTSGDSNITCSEGLSSSSVIASGTFKNVSNGDTLTLTNNMEVTTEEKKYTVWIWIDSSGDDLSSLSSETLDTNIWTLIDMVDGSSINSNDIVNVVVNEGMIPVTISNDGIVKTISSTDSNWYDYSNKKWANAVLVSSSSRNTYLNTSDVTVTQSDILAYYVWIPRFKYKIWTTSVSSIGNEQTIDIIFESKDTPKSKGTKVGEYLTHPAFTFGTEELDGFWAGKFETTGTAEVPTVLPNVQSLRGQNISVQFQTALKFAGGTLLNGNVMFDGNLTYGLTTNTDSHMMKNSEWGAVAYLSHSIYGINEEIYINNSTDYYTGRSGGNIGGSTNTVVNQFPNVPSTDKFYIYGYYSWIGQSLNSNGTISIITDATLGTKASTTGNITGIYDMSGGAAEYVMAVYSDSNGNPRSGNSTSLNSGFNGIVYENGNDVNYTSGINFPSSKYYNLYLSSSNSNCTLATCGGHALYETAGWYSDEYSFVSSSRPWGIRGGRSNYGSDAGVFSLYSSYGYLNNYYSFRSVLVNTKYNTYYSVTYDANGGSGAPSVQTRTDETSSITISNVVPVRNGYRFLGWNTAQDGSGTTYSAGDSYSASENITLYAQWFELLTPTLTTSVSTLNIKMTSTGSGSFTYTYNGDGTLSCSSSNASVAICEVNTSNNTVNIVAVGVGNASITLSAAVGSSYLASSTSVAVNVSLQTYAISYDANGGSGAPGNQIKTYGSTLTLSSEIPKKSGYNFLGWSASSNATSATWSAGGSYTLNESKTLYAVWKLPVVTVAFNLNGGDLSTLYTSSGEQLYSVSMTGEYQLEVWGAQGGTGMADGVSQNDGGYGGYSVGAISLNSGTNLYINVGGKGDDAKDKRAGGAGGYNGGGTGGNDGNYSSSGGNEPGAGGGGATHIATTSGELSTLSSNIDSILIVAGGGGGSSYFASGGAGGGIEGSVGVNTGASSSATVVGGNQTSGNVFGLGGNASNSYNSGGGGGGAGYYGGMGGTGASGVSGGGGSGYIGNSLLTNKYMYCYNCTTSSNVGTKTYTTINVSSTPTADYAKSGNGAARITILSLATKNINYGQTYGDLSTPSRVGYVFLGWNTKADGTGQYVTSSSELVSNNDHTLYAIWGNVTIPIFTYTGTYEVVDDNDNVITNINSYNGNWKIRFLTSGALTITDFNGFDNGVDIFLVGGGGSGGRGTGYIMSSSGGAGGGGGAAITVTNFPIAANTSYSLDIGGSEQNTIFKNGTTAYYTALAGSGSSGGAGRLSGQTSKYGASSVVVKAGSGTGANGNYEFNGTSGKRYGAGGGSGTGGVSTGLGGYASSGSSGGSDGGGRGGSGCSFYKEDGSWGTHGGYDGSSGANNTGSGGGGGGGSCGSDSTTEGSIGVGGAGGTGIIIIRNHR